MAIISGTDRQALGQRIKAAVKAGGGPAKISARSGIPLSSLNKYSRGAVSPGAVALRRIAEATGVSIEALYPDRAAPGPSGVPNEVARQSVVQIPILDVSAGAGAAVDNHDDAEVVAHLPFPVRFLRKLHIKPENVRAVRARGDSMEPTIANGMLVLIDVSFQELQDGRVYALRGLDGLRLKRVQRQLDGSVAIMSDNRDKYLPERLSREEAQTVEVAGRAFWTEKLL